MPKYTLIPNYYGKVREYTLWSNCAGEQITTVRRWMDIDIFVTCDVDIVIEIEDIEYNGINLKYFEEDIHVSNFNYMLKQCYSKNVIEYNGINLKYFEEDIHVSNFNYMLKQCYSKNVSSYPDNIINKRKDRIEYLWEENDSLEEDGWSIIDTEIVVYSEIEIQESQ